MSYVFCLGVLRTLFLSSFLLVVVVVVVVCLFVCFSPPHKQRRGSVGLSYKKALLPFVYGERV